MVRVMVTSLDLFKDVDIKGGESQIRIQGFGNISPSRTLPKLQSLPKHITYTPPIGDTQLSAFTTLSELSIFVRLT